MQTLKSMKDFEQEVLTEQEMVSLIGGIGGPADDLSVKNEYKGTMDDWNCADTNHHFSTDWKGKWGAVTITKVYQETP